MDYTLSPQNVVHAGTGKRMHEDNQAVPTMITDADFNSVIWSLMQLLHAAGVEPAQFNPADPTTYARVLTSVAVLNRRSYGSAASATGSADALIASFDPPVTALVDGLKVHVRASAENVSTAPTFKADATDAKVICKENGLGLSAADIAGAGHRLVLQYDQAFDKWVLLNPSSLAPFKSRQHLSNGYQRLPGGLLLQWLQGAQVTGEGYQDLVWPIAFSSVCLKAFASTGGTDSGSDGLFQVVWYTTTQVQVVANNTGPAGLSPRWPLIFGIGV